MSQADAIIDLTRSPEAATCLNSKASISTTGTVTKSPDCIDLSNNHSSDDDNGDTKAATEARPHTDELQTTMLLADDRDLPLARPRKRPRFGPPDRETSKALQPNTTFMIAKARSVAAAEVDVDVALPPMAIATKKPPANKTSVMSTEMAEADSSACVSTRPAVNAPVADAGEQSAAIEDTSPQSEKKAPTDEIAVSNQVEEGELSEPHVSNVEPSASADLGSLGTQTELTKPATTCQDTCAVQVDAAQSAAMMQVSLEDDTARNDVVGTSRTFIDRLDQELNEFAVYVNLTENEIHARNRFVTGVGIAARKAFPNSTLSVFGSFASLAVSTFASDIDLAIHGVVRADKFAQRDVELPEKLRKTINGVLHNVRNELRRKAFVNPATLQILTAARVPLLKMLSRVGIEIDVSVGDLKSSDTSLFASLQIEKYKSFSAVVLFLKVLLRDRDLDKPYKGYLGSFKLYYLVAYHLQQHVAAGGTDRPGEVLKGFLWRFGSARVSCDDPYRTPISQDVVLRGVDGYEADLSGVFRLEECVDLFGWCHGKLLNMEKSVEPESLRETFFRVIELDRQRQQYIAMAESALHERPEASSLRAAASGTQQLGKNRVRKQLEHPKSRRDAARPPSHRVQPPNHRVQPPKHRVQPPIPPGNMKWVRNEQQNG